MRKSEHGFTIIELVVVIAILGILGAVALPKFANMSQQARVSAFSGVRAGYTAAVMIAHSQWLADGASNVTNTITLEGTSIELNGSGWPTVNAGFAQTNGMELWAKLMSGALPGKWVGTTFNGTMAEFEFQDPPGMFSKFEYDPANGSVVTTVAP